MENEAQSPALNRLERAIGALETALRERPVDARAVPADAALEQRHSDLKRTVATCIGEIDDIIGAARPGSDDHA